jgi:hypothetical protein
MSEWLKWIIADLGTLDGAQKSKRAGSIAPLGRAWTHAAACHFSAPRQLDRTRDPATRATLHPASSGPVHQDQGQAQLNEADILFPEYVSQRETFITELGEGRKR